MKKILLVCAGIVSVILLNAQTILGPKGGGTFGTTTLSGSSNNWVNPGNVAASDGLYATFGNLPIAVGSHTNYLIISNFGFSVPAGAIINGISVDVQRSDPNRQTGDYSIKILQGGSVGGTEHSSGTIWPATDQYQTYGAPSDLWGLSWTPAQINDPGFGVAIAAQRLLNSTSTGGQINYVQVTVYYNFILPVKLISFSAQKNNGNVHVSWVTTEESQMSGYVVERSSDGRHFSPIGTVNSLNLSFNHTYSLDDNSPLPGTAYYRLKMVGIDGDVNYSKTVTVKSGLSSTSSILYPNPYRMGENLTVNNPGSEQLIIQFYNLAGQSVSVVNTNSSQVPSQQLPVQKGMLIYKVMSRDGTVLGTGKLIVQ
jgi:hypothetical protein